MSDLSPKPIRVLIVDDSPTLRTLIKQIIETDPAMQVIGTADEGRRAIELCQRLDPDIVTMDIHMPGMDGYETIRHIMAEFPRPIVVLTSTASDIRYNATFKSIQAGALMVIGKPHGLPAQDAEARQLIQQLKAMAGVKVVRRRWHLQPKPKAHQVRAGALVGAQQPFSIMAMGASTGGPPALQRILQQFPSHLPLPVLVVQHISKGFIGGMVRWLSDTTRLPVKLAENDELLLNGHVYFAPDDRQLQVSAQGRAQLIAGPPVDGHRPSVTALFTSVAQAYGSAAIGILLTGMGRDGAGGLASIRDAGGHTIVQDEKSAVVFGMPKAAIDLAAAEEILALSQIGKRALALVSGR